MPPVDEAESAAVVFRRMPSKILCCEARFHGGARLFVDQQQSLELLAATHVFPGKYVFKAIGRMENDFTGRVLAAVRTELQQSFDAPYQTRETSNGRHVSVTVEPWTETPEQVLAIYGRLKGEAGLVMLF